MNLYLITFILMIFGVSCNKSRPQKYRITYYQKLDDGTHYSKDTFTYRNNRYRPAVTSEYIDDTIASVWIFKTEGKMQYSSVEIKRDTLLKAHYHISDRRAIKIEDELLIDNGATYPITEFVNDSIYCYRKDALILYEIE